MNGCCCFVIVVASLYIYMSILPKIKTTFCVMKIIIKKNIIEEKETDENEQIVIKYFMMV